MASAVPEAGFPSTSVPISAGLKESPEKRGEAALAVVSPTLYTGVPVNTMDGSAFNQARLDSLAASGLLDQYRHADFERVTALASKMLKVPVCLVSLVDEKRQVFVGACGLPSPYDEVRETPLTHSFCQHAVTLRRPLIIRDAREVAMVSENEAIADLGVIAYLGFPLLGADYHVYGAFCVIDSKPRDWTEEEIETARDFTAMVSEQIELHLAKQRQKNSIDILVHDLKSPLSGIRMVASLLKERAHEMPDHLRPLSNALEDSTDKALGLIESLSRRDREIAAVCPDLCGVLSLLIQEYRHQAEQKGLSISYHESAEVLPISVADWVVKQAAENLLTNAIKFTPAGGSIRVSVRGEGNLGVFEIADDGPGFQEEDYAHLFRRYARMSARPTADEPSTGLGLSIVKRLIEQEGGSVTLLSAPGESAVFRVVLPLVTQDS